MTPRARKGLLLVAGGLAVTALAWWQGWMDQLLRYRGGPAQPDDADALARLMLTESSGGGIGQAEGAGIAYVALGRRKNAPATYPTVESVFTRRAGRSWFGATRSRGYCYATSTSLCPGQTRAGKLVREHPRWTIALAQAQRVLAGTEPNPIGERTHFVHPGGMPECSPGDAPTKTRICQPWKGGFRRFPTWAVSTAAGGAAQYPPVVVDPAVFAGGLGQPPLVLGPGPAPAMPGDPGGGTYGPSPFAREGLVQAAQNLSPTHLMAWSRTGQMPGAATNILARLQQSGCCPGARATMSAGADPHSLAEGAREVRCTDGGRYVMDSWMGGVRATRVGGGSADCQRIYEGTMMLVERGTGA